MQNILSTKGLTSTEANHIANITKELVKGIESGVINLGLEKTFLVQSDNSKLQLNSPKVNSNIEADVLRIGELYSLSAWLKNAIKFKETKMDNLRRESFIFDDSNFKLESPNVTPLDTTFETYLNSLNTKVLNEYFTNEAKAAHIGKFVHNFDSVREGFKSHKPFQIEQTAHGTLIYENVLVYDEEELLKVFFNLQKEHREAESKVNFIKAKYKEWAKDEENKRNSLLKEIFESNKSISEKRELERKTKTLEFENDKKQKISDIASMKIIVPDDLQTILDFVLEYSKK